MASEKPAGAVPSETAEGPILVCPTLHQMRGDRTRRGELDVLGLAVVYKSHTLLSSVVTGPDRGSMFTTSVTWNSRFRRMRQAVVVEIPRILTWPAPSFLERTWTMYVRKWTGLNHDDDIDTGCSECRLRLASLGPFHSCSAVQCMGNMDCKHGGWYGGADS